ILPQTYMYLPPLLNWNAHADQPPHPQKRPHTKMTDIKVTMGPLSFYNLSGRSCENKEPSGGHSVRNSFVRALEGPHCVDE
ncbi:hypothetical protein N7489_005002, partial [Penicillium chrysogenum]|uniref:uncharacterized protein n=1 Tax=Penicillium chrysogenum TaxID=5076 RepID=UPI0024DF0AE3